MTQTCPEPSQQPGLHQLPSAGHASPGERCAGKMGFVRADLKETLIGIQFPCNFFPLQLQLLWPWTINFWHFRQNEAADRALRRCFSEEHIYQYTISCIINSLNNHISAGSDRRTSLLHLMWDVHTRASSAPQKLSLLWPHRQHWQVCTFAKQLTWSQAWCALLRCQFLINWLQGVLIFF